MATPFFKVFVRKDIKDAKDKDISSIISRFSYEDAVDVDNMLTLDVRKDGLMNLNDSDLQEGSIVTFYWGFLGGMTSQKYVSRLSNIQPSYRETVNIVFQCSDLGLLLKKNKSKKDWKGYTSSQIVQSIADFYGLTAFIDSTDKVWSFMPQGGQTDYNFIKYLATIEKNGSWRFFMKHNAIYFTRLALEQSSIKTFTYQDGNGDLIYFNPSSRETSKSNAARDTVVTSIDPFTNEPIQKKVNDGTAKDDQKLGEYGTHIFNADGKEVATTSNSTERKRPSQIQAAKNDPNRAGQHILTPDSERAEDIGNTVKKGATINEYMAELEAVGDPLILSDMIITMSNVAVRDAGNWYVTRAKHILDSNGGYKINLSLNKNAANRQNSDAQSNVNKTVGDKKPEVKKKVEVIGFNEDSIEVYRKQK